MKRKAKELQQLRRGMGNMSGGMGSNSMSSSNSNRSFAPQEPITTSEPLEPAYQAPIRYDGGTSLRLNIQSIQSFIKY